MGNVSRSISPPEAPHNRKSTSTSHPSATSDGAGRVHKKIKVLGEDWASISPDEYYSPEVLANKMFPFPKNASGVSIN